MQTKIIISLILIIFLTACGVVPDYKAPKEPKNTAYTVSDDLVNKQQHIALGKELQADWWTVFANEDLNRTIAQALADNYSIANARKTLAAAEEAIKSKRGALWPQIGINAGVANQLYGVAFFGPSIIKIPQFTAIELGPTINWDLDLLGSTKYAVEQKRALALYQMHNLDAVYLMITGNVVNQALEVASAKAELEIVQRIINEDQKTLKLVQTKYKVGSATRLDVIEAQNRLDSDLSQLPNIKQRIMIAQHALAILVGQAPADWQQPNFTFASFTLPKKLPVRLPSALVHKRPDILAAEANLHATHALVGVATANLYPNIVISGNLFQEALNLRTLFNSSSTAWSIAATLTQPLFQGGTLRAEKRKAEHTYKASLAQYQQTVLIAFREVADALATLATDAEAVEVWQNTVATATESLALAFQSYKAGSTNLLQLQESQRSYERAQLNLLKAKRQQFIDTAQLFVTLGGSPFAKSEKKAEIKSSCGELEYEQ